MDDSALISYVLSANRRYDILSVLLDGNYTAQEISAITKISYKYVLVKLKELYNNELITDNGMVRSRIYSITPLGRKIVAKISANIVLYNKEISNGFNRR